MALYGGAVTTPRPLKDFLITNASEDNIGIAQLVGYWRSLQKWKDNHTRQGGCSGRNLPAGPSNRPPGDEDKNDLSENGLSEDDI